MSNGKNGAQSSTHVSGTTHSDDDDSEIVFNDVGQTIAQFHTHPAAVSIFIDQKHHIVDCSNSNNPNNEKFTKA